MITPIPTRGSPGGPISAPPSGLPARSGAVGAIRILALLGAFFLTAMSAHASHFRGASLTWKRLASPANTIELTVTESWIFPANGNPTGQTWQWGDGTATFSTVGSPVIATGSGFQIIRKVITHTYSTEGPWTILASSGARISSLVNSANSSWRQAAVVDLRSSNQGCPVISSPINLQMIKGGLNTVPMSFSDVDGDPVTFRMATTAESSINVVPTAPTPPTAGGKVLAVSSAGVLTWDTTSTVVGQLYAAQVIATDNHPLSPSGTGTTSVPFDFIIQIVDGTLNHPPVASGNGGPFNLVIGQPYSNVITGTDQDGGNLTVSHLGLPAGATLTPASGTNAAQPLAATFSWTPTLADAGSSVGVTILFTDPTGLQANKSFSMSVPSNQPPFANAGPDQTIYDIDGNDAAIIVGVNGGASYDPEGVALTYAWTQTGGTPVVVLANANTATPSFTAPDLKIHPNGQPLPLQLIFRLDVSDGKTTRSDDVLIIVKHNNLTPVAVAFVPATAPEGSAVTLDGSGSSDPDQDPLSYTWVQTAGTPVSLVNNGTNNPLMVFSHMVPGPHSIAGETLEFTLTVSDGIVTNTSAPVQVFIQNVNTAPTADAGDNDSVYDNVGLVTLDGSGSDFDGDPISYHWSQVAGTPVTLNNATSATPSFTAPAVTPAQGSVTLTFQLITNDSFGPGDTGALNSAPSSVDILVKHANRAPVADAGLPKDVPEETAVALDGSASYDPDQDQLTYAWTQTGGVHVKLNATDSAHPTFISPSVGPLGASLTFELIVTDNGAAAPAAAAAPAGPAAAAGPAPAAGPSDRLSSAPSAVVITVNYVNEPPVAVAAPVAACNEGTGVSLDGSQSSDPDGNAFTYLWSQVSGPNVVGLSSATDAMPTFTAPAVNRFGATVVFELRTTDEFGAVSNIATTSIVINNVNQAPVADAGMLQTVFEDTDVGLAGLGIDQDSEEQALLTYAWVQTEGPTVVLLNRNTPNPSFHAPVVTGGGDPNAKVKLKFALTVTDPNHASGSAPTTVCVANVDHAPTANAGGIITNNESYNNSAVVVTLNGADSSDPDNDPLSFAWVQTSGPAVVLANANTAYPSFTAPFVNAAGATLKFKLTVKDPWGGVSVDTATVVVVNNNTPPTLSNPRASVGELWPPNHNMVKVSILGVVDPNNNATITITGVTQDEATNGLGDGDTAIDALINADGSVLLRAERSGKGNGRVYHIHFRASDFESQASGTSVSGVVNVSVPHDKKGDVAIDGGELFDSTR